MQHNSTVSDNDSVEESVNSKNLKLSCNKMKKIRKDLALFDSFEIAKDPYFKNKYSEMMLSDKRKK